MVTINIRKISYKVAKLILIYVATLVVASLLTFIALEYAPGDVTFVILKDMWTPQAAAQLRESLGLNRPIYIRYVEFVWNALHGDLGYSWLSPGHTVSGQLIRALPNSVALAVVALLIVVGVGVPLGIFASLRRGKVIDFTIRGGFVILSSIPLFWLGLELMILFAVVLHWLPSGGIGGPQHLILPAITLASFYLAGMMRFTRACMLDVLSEGYVTTARAKGLRERDVILKHALRGATIPIVTVIGTYLGAMIGSTIITEVIFSWPGIGTLLMNSLLGRDRPMALGVIMVITVVFVTINMAVDLFYKLIDPRIEV